ncbi:glutathione S-transferase family protein [Aquitalea aquatica]|uniref:Glutathione S-transferase family protein n=1 Tax=Aquitalea aquatica TaxID=3044273 RepID=A0A838Y0Q6_9NEIS|nr:glutathione S-transferase family protein [Aquitalea magnusonii]MBA4707478.1 glutathione S-transferase family protein [Aquitalea magnusonii]
MFTLIIGNKNLSSWSLRPWLVLKMLNEPFEEKRIDLTASDCKTRILACNPAGKVPLLIDQQLRIGDSLAICEYLAECFPAAGLWPDDAATRAIARAVVAEMHAGFAALRSELPMNVCGDFPAASPSAAAQADIARISSLWESLRQQHQGNGPFLFGQFSIADAFFAPVVWRFHSYHVALDGQAAAYAAHMRQLPAMQEWLAAAQREEQASASSK